MNIREPTSEEKSALERIETIQRLSLVAIIAMIAAFSLLRFMPEEYSAIAAILSIAAVLGVFSILVYRACFLRCPRCSGWIAIAKCPACGLELGGRAARAGSVAGGRAPGGSEKSKA